MASAVGRTVSRLKAVGLAGKPATAQPTDHGIVDGLFKMEKTTSISPNAYNKFGPTLTSTRHKQTQPYSAESVDSKGLQNITYSYRDEAHRQSPQPNPVTECFRIAVIIPPPPIARKMTARNGVPRVSSLRRTISKHVEVWPINRFEVQTAHCVVRSIRSGTCRHIYFICNSFGILHTSRGPSIRCLIR
nr:hypothetical protein L203_06100 [Cryptococcus depauperatus CBS 7841]